MKASLTQIVVAALAIFVLTSAVIAQTVSYNHVREWQSTKGTVISGRLESVQVNAQDERVAVMTVIKKPLSATDTPREAKIEIKLSDLSDADNKYILARQFIEHDRLQFDQVAQEIQSLRDTQDTSISTLKSLCRQYKDAPYASLWAGVILSAVRNDPHEAIDEFDDAISRCKKQRESDQFRHRLTLTSALNNKAVALIKLRDEPKAAMLFIQALALVERVPPVMVHNINQLLEMTSSRNFPRSRKIKDSEREQLMLAQTRPLSGGERTKFQVGYYYSLHMDAPSSSGNELSVDRIQPPDEALELISVGTGIVIAQDRILTVHPVVSHPSRSPRLTTVAINHRNDQWQLRPAITVLTDLQLAPLPAGSMSTSTSTENTVESGSTDTRTSPSNSSTGSTGTSRTFPPRTQPGFPLDSENTSKRGNTTKMPPTKNGANSSAATEGYKGATTTYSYVNHIDGSPNPALAVIHIPGLDIPPVTFNATDELPTENVAVWGFNRGADMLSKGFRESNGLLIEVDKRNQTTAIVSGGARGGPVIDKKMGNILGVGSSAANDKNTGARGEFVNISDVKSWLQSNLQTIELQPRDPGDTSTTSRLRQIKLATVPVLTWGMKSDLNDQVYQSFYNQENLTNLFIIRDQWCLNCQGKGTLKCGDCRGKGEHQNGTVRVGNGLNPVNGAQMYLDVPNIVPCLTCERRGRIKCEYCNGGRVRGGAHP